jgi:purine-binding chemotaxis protein CheW
MSLADMSASADDPRKWVFCRVGTRTCALPLALVAETMRALPVMPLANSAGFVSGASIIRGVPVPIVDAGALFGEPPIARQRLVTIDVGGRWVALAVDGVSSAGKISEDKLRELPPLLSEAATDAISAIGVLDGEFLLCLEVGRLIPDETLDPLGVALSPA